MKKQKGFTLIELLIVVAIIGIIAAIAIPNLLNAIDRGKQKRTMADMRSIGTAVESYAVDNNVYPVAASAATAQRPHACWGSRRARFATSSRSTADRKWRSDKKCQASRWESS